MRKERKVSEWLDAHRSAITKHAARVKTRAPRIPHSMMLEENGESGGHRPVINQIT